MTQYGDPEGTFSSIHMSATGAEVDAYRAAPQFAVSRSKLFVMSLCTFGLYELYWAYKHWVAIRQRERENLMPFWRAFFGVLWAFSLFPRIQRLAAGHGIEATWSGSVLALAYLILEASWRLPDPLWLVSFLSVLPLLVVQGAVNKLNAALAPDAPRNNSYSGLNVAIIIVGGLFLLLAILGTLVPVPEELGELQLPVTT
jgi:hypothetical protein